MIQNWSQRLNPECRYWHSNRHHDGRCRRTQAGTASLGRTFLPVGSGLLEGKVSMDFWIDNTLTRVNE
ncbi:hypothetical protein EC604_20855 [Paenibacillus amylolyticus]|uniref:Uncharacterized protein n=1 Tax=Paenibacillus amylolyticus TaxID=1451 RepID=A0A5M9WXF0_PAEAM|nr:hypothetical protein EC604_20855 [Paenibacillus amylolyticus]